MSDVVLGTRRLVDWGMSASELASFLEGALESGVSTLDTADVYGDHTVEAALGAVFRRSSSLRERIQLVTKCGVREKSPEVRIRHYDASRTHVVAQVENSLRALSTDRIDILLIDQPDPLLDADELAEAFCALKQSGKVRGFGVANFSTHELELLQSRLPFPLIVNQIEFSLMRAAPISNGTLSQCQKMRIVPMASSPLAGGRLGASGSEGGSVSHALERIANEIGLTPAQVALAWVMRHPSGPVPVIATGKLERVRLAAAAAQLKLDRMHWFELLEAVNGHEVV